MCVLCVSFTAMFQSPRAVGLLPFLAWGVGFVHIIHAKSQQGCVLCVSFTAMFQSPRAVGLLPFLAWGVGDVHVMQSLNKAFQVDISWGVIR